MRRVELLRRELRSGQVWNLGRGERLLGSGWLLPLLLKPTAPVLGVVKRRRACYEGRRAGASSGRMIRTGTTTPSARVSFLRSSRSFIVCISEVCAAQAPSDI